MAEIAAQQASAEVSWSQREDTARIRDLILGASAFTVIFSVLISVEYLELLFDFTRAHEDWELLDEILASVPALALVTSWYGFRRWQEARRLNLELADANEALKISHARQLAAEAQLRDAQRLESLGRMAGGLAHELNNMLQPVITLAQLMLKNHTLPADARAKLQMILEAAEYSRDIVGKALTFAGGQSQDKDTVVFSTCLKEVVDFAQTALPSTIEVEIDIPDYPDSALINRTELTQIITNLMTNAASAMECHGKFSIALSVVEMADADAATLGLSAGSYFQILISDTGCGMPDEVQRRVFDPFFTTGAHEANVGLGLAVIHGIISDWQGKISLRSKPGHGTCFTILIPVAGT